MPTPRRRRRRAGASLSLRAAWPVVIALLICRWAPADAQSAESAGVPVLTLEGLLRRASDRNPAVDIARAELAKYEALFDRAYYAWTPQLKVESLLAPLPERRLLQRCVDVSNVDPSSGLPLVLPCPGQDIADDEALTADTEIGILTRTTARLTLPIYTFGKIDAAQQAGRAGMEVGRAGVRVAQNRLGFEIKRAYYGAQLAHSVLDILDDGRGRLKKAKDQTEKELEKESGKFTRNDLRQLIVQEADLEARYLETEALAAMAWEGLRIAGGFGPGEEFTLDTMELRPVSIEARTQEDYLEQAFISRPDLRLANAGALAEEGRVGMAVADLFPDIALVGAFTYAKGTTADDNPDPFANDSYNVLGWGVVLAASWNINLADRLTKVKEAEARLGKVRAQREALLMQVRLQIAEHLGQVRRYQGALKARRMALKASKGWLVSNSLNFGLGLTTTDQLLKSLVSYSQSRVEYFSSIYEYNLAVARLSQAVGVELALPPLDEDEEEDD